MCSENWAGAFLNFFCWPSMTVWYVMSKCEISYWGTLFCRGSMRAVLSFGSAFLCFAYKYAVFVHAQSNFFCFRKTSAVTTSAALLIIGWVWKILSISHLTWVWYKYYDVSDWTISTTFSNLYEVYVYFVIYKILSECLINRSLIENIMMYLDYTILDTPTKIRGQGDRHR